MTGLTRPHREAPCVRRLRGLARGFRPWARFLTRVGAGNQARIRSAERADQSGDPLELIALRVEVEGAKADDDVTRSGGDVAAKVLGDRVRGAVHAYPTRRGSG